MSTSVEVPDYIHQCVRALPVLPTAVTRLLTLTREVEVDFREIARVIESDPTLMARVLRAANSPLYSVSRRVKTVQQATVLLGTETIVNMAVGVSVMSLQNGLHKHLPVDAELYGRHGIAVALAARQLALHFGLPNSGEAFVAGLLHDIGKLVLLMHYGEDYARLMKQACAGGRSLHDLEHGSYDLDHALVGHALCLHWNLPPSTVEAVAEHHNDPAPRSLGDVVSRANDLVKLLQIGDSCNRHVSIPAASGQPRDSLGWDWLRNFVSTLPEETRKTEEAMGHGSGSAAEVVTKEVVRTPIHVQIQSPEEREQMKALLFSIGYEPILAHEAGSNGHGVPAALVTDAAATDLYRLAFQQKSLPVLDIGAWRAEHVNGDTTFDIYSLRGWVATSVQAPAV